MTIDKLELCTTSMDLRGWGQFCWVLQTQFIEKGFTMFASVFKWEIVGLYEAEAVSLGKKNEIGKLKPILIF